MNDITIRVASPDDAQEILKIYAPYVEKTAITFEYDVPSVKDFRRRIEHTLENYPYIVAECGDEIIGYAYTGSFIGREAYNHSAETSIYVAENSRHGGVGRRLYEAIEEISAAQKITIDNFWKSMARHSYLFIGHSESLFGMDTKFEFLKTPWACLYQKNEK